MTTIKDTKEFNESLLEKGASTWSAAWEGVDHYALTSVQRLEKVADTYQVVYEEAARKSGEMWQYAEQQGDLESSKYWVRQ